MQNRRHFLKLAFLVGVVPQPARASEEEIFSIFASAVLGNTNYNPKFFSVWYKSFQKAVSLRPQNEQEDFNALIMLLRSPWLRWTVGAPIGAFTVQSMSSMLDGWKTSRFDLLRRAYSSLVSLANASWYVLPESWPYIAYPGPPEKWWNT